MPIQVVIPTDKNKLEQQIEALQYLLQQDINDKDREIHSKAITSLKEAFDNL
ncbi:hypothetical protein ABEP00_20400 [Heyndrickxia sporothermodurans]|jgi:hypothetical protein|uniref:hypothetical protein n=1 Tax=Heyndrickxia TaxID=2837504 RepID=UPI0003A661D4|nr:hypothetical protein [Heyndrickxia oleronia]MEC1376492.1 hypothetical protein [Heyndrickxia oleronia]QQZ06219.1 hypothetical protein I5818_07180 [Heyndrickxia oleronia]